MAVNRGCYIGQSQSLNISMGQVNSEKLTSLHFHAWCKVIMALCLSESHDKAFNQSYLYVSAAFQVEEERVLQILYTRLFPTRVRRRGSLSNITGMRITHE
uniref:Uncharacterized protein n=4 Tax=Aegilops tauschii subsp. strangulata TaxID=200361 RepID=A0A453LSP9_AEGTS